MSTKVCVVTQDKLASEPFANEIKQIFGEALNISHYCTEEILAVPKDDILAFTLCIVSAHTIKRQIETYVGTGINIVFGQRILATTNVKELLKIKDGSEVVVAMALEEVAIDTIRLLKDMGFAKFNYHPYWPEKKELPEKADVAITAGGPHHVAGRIEKIINLGPRRLDLYSIFQIISLLDLPFNLVNEVSKNYTKEFIGLSIDLSSHSKQLVEIRTFLSNILNNVTSGIVALDLAENIKFINDQAITILGRNTKVGDSLAALPIDVSNVRKNLSNKTTIRNKVVVINEERISLDMLPVSADGVEGFGALIILRSVSSIQESEERLRAQILKKGFFAKYSFHDIVSDNPLVKDLVSIAKNIASSDLSILLCGESGVGKEVFAQAIHNHSPRKNRPFLAINFAGLPASLVESELFGYDDGAFTGARKGGRIGLIEQAHGGTLLLDEIGDASPDIQMHLLRFLEEKRIIRVGGSESIPVDVRIIAATNKNLAESVSNGQFREDLYYRLCVAPIDIPPLRERKKDIPLLIDKIWMDSGLAVRLDKEMIDFFTECEWPGNIRQLKNVLSYLFTVYKDRKRISLEDGKFVLRTITDGAKRRPPDRQAVVAIEHQNFGLDHGYQGLFGLILSEIDNHPGIGRYTIFGNLARRGIPASEYKIRKALKYLSVHGFVNMGTTKQGSCLTDKGRLLLKQEMAPGD
jgi:transcriptional regulator with PAS, ATPase and Fis domain